MAYYLPAREELDRELERLPFLKGDALRKRYLGSGGDAGYLVEFVTRSPNNAAAVNWLTSMSDLWEQVRLSLAWASAYDTWYGGLTEGMVPEELLEGNLRDSDFEELVHRWEEAEAGCIYYLENALYRFYAFNEMFLQFCNGYMELDVPEDQVRGRVIERRLVEASQAGNASAQYLANELAKLCRSPAYQHIVEARKGITHRHNPFRGRTVQEEVFEDRTFSCPRMLRLAQKLFTDITQLLDQLLEFIASQDRGTAAP